MDAQEVIQLIGLANALEPTVLAFIKNLMHQGQGKTGDEFLAEADTIWAQIKANAQNELGG
jgi:hypothetical protein